MAQEVDLISPRVKIKEANKMKCFFTRALAASLLFGASWLALSSPLRAADDAPTFRQADKSLSEALAKGDRKSVV